MSDDVTGGRTLGAVRALLEGAVGTAFAAAQLLVVDDGVVAFDEAVGDCTPATLFDLASLTKPLVTTTLVMRLLEQRALSLDDEVRPGVPLRLLLCHASGLPAWRPFFQLLAPRLGEPGFDPRRAVIEAARAEPLTAPPGSRSVYSDLGFLLLGDAVERAGGSRLDAQWGALGLCEATFHPDPDSCAPTEVIDGVPLRGLVHDDNCRFMGGVAGHAGLFGNSVSVSRAVASLVETWRGRSGGVVSPATLQHFWSPANIPDSVWCLGWDRPSGALSSAGTRWPRDGVGHLAFTGCSIWIDPPRRRWVVLLTNRVHPTRANESIKPFRPRLHDAIVSALDG